MFELGITLPPRGSRVRLRVLHEELRAAILEGRLKPGLRLPSTRSLADAYRLSRKTAAAAYDLLLSEGYVTTRRGAGTYVAKPRGKRSNHESTGPTAASPSEGDRRLTAFWRSPPSLLLKRWAGTPDVPFRVGMPDRNAFPYPLWRRLSVRALRAVSNMPAAYTEAQGRLPLRECIANHLSFTRAVACRADDVIVTAGAQQAFDLLARILVTPRRTTVAVEDPGYPSMRAAFMAAGAKVVGVPVDGEGLIVERLPRNARVICVTPSHQFPLGVVMSARRRAALLEFARAHDAVIMEDDYDGEFRFGASPLDALQTSDRAESVIYVGTFSKSLFPGIRLGFIVVPPWARRALIGAKQCADWHSNTLAQETLAAFMAGGHMVRHVRKMRTLYAGRRALLIAMLEQQLSRWLQPVPSVGGLHLAAFTRTTADAEIIQQAARQSGQEIRSLRPYYLAKPGRPGVLLGFGNTSEAEITDSLSRLRRVLGPTARS